ncbi:MAG: anthranilate phosphoribosyltransferase [Chloroflexota bacterium]
MALKPYIAEVINGRSLGFDQAKEAMTIVMTGQATQAQIGSYLTALRMKGETTEEVGGSAAAMRELYIPVKPANNGDIIMDVVGTGGDGRHTFNISTTTAFVVAGVDGYRIAKHGNRGASSKSGSADVLMALGANLDIGPEQVGACIDEVGIGFMFAVKHHPAMRHAIGPRRELGQRTVFNILGPLTNPADAKHYMIGTYAPHLTDQMGGSLRDLGAESAFVVHGADGLDELSTTGVNKLTHLLDGKLENIELSPSDIGLPIASLDDLIGGEPDENAKITRDILGGKLTGPKLDIVLLNAAAALSTQTRDFAAGLARARESITSGKALATLDAWVAKTNQ